MIKLLACGQFKTMIDVIKRHKDYRQQDEVCRKVIDEIDSVDRILTELQANSSGTSIPAQ